MRALEWRGKEKLVVNADHPKPQITEAGDVIVKITHTTICGSDLHLYHNKVAGMEKGDVIGHEGIGYVDEVGPDVKNFKKGDRVVVSAVIADGTCDFCKQGKTSLCRSTNPSEEMSEQFGGNRTASLFGYSHLTGGIPGLCAEFTRVPLADFNCLKLPSEEELSNAKAICLSDILNTAWHGLTLSNANKDRTLCVWGAGPIGATTAYLGRVAKGIKNLVVIDNVDWRLDLVK